MQLTHSLEISLPGVVSSQAEQDDAQLVKASQHGNQDAFAFLPTGNTKATLAIWRPAFKQDCTSYSSGPSD